MGAGREAGEGMFKTKTAASVNYKQLYEEQLKINAEQASLIASLRKENHELRKRDAPLSNNGYEYLANLQYRVKDLSNQVSDFKSGERYIKIQADHKEHLCIKNREIEGLKQELAQSRRQTIDVRNKWIQVNEDLIAEHAKELSRKDREIEALKKKVLNLQNRCGEWKDRFLDARRELYEVKTELEDKEGIIQKLKAQINRDYENSSKPSSMSPNRKKIHNSRVPTGKKPGGQPGHPGHGRKKQVPTSKINIPPPPEWIGNPDYKPTGKVITKQLVGIRVILVVNEYSTVEYRNVRTWERVHADFPDGVVNDVNYDGSVKAFAFLLNNHCHVSIAKVSDFLSELTGGELNISTGMICGLSKEFSLKTEAEQNEAFADLLLSPVMCTDFTTVRVDGKNMNVIVCADGRNILYSAREHKGHEGVKGTPVEGYQNTLVHDHDKTFYSYGGNHQECNQHPSRYLKGSMENEPGLKWAGLMRELIQQMIHFKKSLDPYDDRDPNQIDGDAVDAFEARYDEILALAKDEYDYEPPSKYNMDGFNLYKRMEKYKANHLLFLHDRRVPATNNESERLLRVVKRKGAQAMTFRSFNSLDYLCRSLGIVASLRTQGSNLYASVASIYDRVKDK
jgi:predicted  nucleic acid-binding Zn-ribbon protein